MLLNHKLLHNQSLSFKITPQLVQKMNILQMSSFDLCAYIQEQLADNPLLEADFSSDYSDSMEKRDSGKYNNGNSRDVLLELAQAPDETLETACLSQLRIDGSLDQRHYRIAAFLLGNLQDNGFMNISLEEASAYLYEPLEAVERALQAVQMLEPAGVGARNLRECLQIQIRSDPDADSWAYSIVSEYLNELGRGKLQRIVNELGISMVQVKQSLAYIRKLNPRPGLLFYRQPARYIEPDAFIFKGDEGYSIVMNDDSIPNIYWNPYYKQLRNESDNKKIKTYINEHIQSVRWLTRCLDQRKMTIFRVIEAIVQEQSLFFEKGLYYLKPMKLITIAEKLNFSESTISRAMQNKWIWTPQGLFDLKFFLTNGLVAMQGKVVSTTCIKEKIRELIDKENKSNPLSDQQITDLLQQDGTKISRRTVMKYREELHLLSSRSRSISC